MSAGQQSGLNVSDGIEAFFQRLYYSFVEEDFNCLSVITRYYSFRDHRKVLLALNLIMCLISIGFAGYASWLAYLFYDTDQNQNAVYWGWAGFAVLSVLLIAVCIIGMRGAHLVSLDHILIYFWAILLFVGPFLLGVVACIDFYEFLYVWFKHQWELSTFSGMREIFCMSHSNDTGMSTPLLLSFLFYLNIYTVIEV